MERTITALHPHPENTKIYGDSADAALVASIRSKGILTPLLITASGVIISGHRRWEAAKVASLASVPVSVFQSTDPLDILEALIESNRQRVKNGEQIGREAQALLGIEAERAKQRQAEQAAKNLKQGAKLPNGEPVPTSGKELRPIVYTCPDCRHKYTKNDPHLCKGRARDAVGAKVGTSGRTAERAAYTVQVMDTLSLNGKTVEAHQIKQQLHKNVTKAHTLAKALEPLVKPVADSLLFSVPTQEKYITLDAWETLNQRERAGLIAAAPIKSKEGMNEQKTDFIEWAQWSWNPVVGCLHNCSYCVSGDTLVLMADGTSKPIKYLSVGEKIIGTRLAGHYRYYQETTVLAHWSTVKRAYRIRLANGTALVCSADHRWLTESRGWKYTAPSSEPTRDARGRETVQRPILTTNNHLLGLGTAQETPIETDTYRKGYLSGMVRGDGTRGIYGKQKLTYQFRLALKDQVALDRTVRYLEHFGVVAQSFVFSQAVGARAEMNGIRTSTQRSLDRINELIAWQDDAEYRRGFLAGMFDAEGGQTGNNRSSVLRLFNSDPELLQTFEAGLREHGFSFVYDVPHQSSPTGKVVRVIRLTGGLREHLRFFQLTDPAIRRKFRIEGAAVKSQVDLRIVEIEDLGLEMPMYDIMTGTEDFLANGVIAHNCYARDIAEKLYPNKFAPAFVPARLHTPRNVKVPEMAVTSIGHKNIFTCSMADLFGKWVPQEWIEAVLTVVRDCPQWNFLFLTKFPLRLAEFTFPDNAWVGTSVDCQARVESAEKAFRKVKASVKWLSCEPLLEDLTFRSLSMFQWVVIGGASPSTQTPEFKPPRAWVNHLWTQAVVAGCQVYEKTNLLDRLREYPGQTAPVSPETITSEFHYPMLKENPHHAHPILAN